MSQQPLAYLDPEFLESDEARPIRILSEYLEPLRRFRIVCDPNDLGFSWDVECTTVSPPWERRRRFV